MTDILKRLDHEPSYCEHSDAKQLRVDAASEIRRLNKDLWDARTALSNLQTAMLRANSNKMTRRF